MKKSNDKSGFTLIEIIVVLIIVGILAAIALPNLFSNIQKSKGAEAVVSISSYRPTMEGCIEKQSGNNDNLCSQASLGNVAASPNFSYQVLGPGLEPGAGPAGTDTGYSIIATGTGELGAVYNAITITRAPAVWPNFGAVTCAGTSQLSGAC